jgi:hypothetical protein
MDKTYNTIYLKSYTKIFEEYEVEGSAVKPGMLVELTSNNKVKKHATAGGQSIPMFVIEDKFQGKAISDSYVAGDRAQVWIPTRGDQVYALLADEQSVSVGDFLESNGAGYLRKHTGVNSLDDVTQNVIVAQALEAQDLSNLEASDSSLATNSQWIKVRIV